MNSLTFIGIGSLARKGDVAYVRFCFVGADHAQPDEEVGRAREIVNSVGVSILLGVIDAAQDKGAKVVLSGVNAPTVELFEMLGVTRHVEIS